MKQRIKWQKTTVGGYKTQRFGGWFTGEVYATITPDGDDWLVAVNAGKCYYEICKTAAQAKRAAAKKIRDAIK